jgi:uncharacterized protein
MFGSMLIFIVTMAHIYVFWRAASVPFMKCFSRKFFVCAGVGLWTTFFLGRTIGHDGTSAFAALLEMAGMTWMGVLFLSLVFLLLVDLFTGFGFFLPRKAPMLRGLALIIGGALSVIALVQGLRAPVVDKYDVFLAGLPKEMDGTVLVAMSDLHLGSQIGRPWLEARVDQVREQRPDLVLLLGDVFDGHNMPEGNLLPAFQRLSAPLGVWAVPGNHEFYGNNTCLPLIKAAGIKVLLNRWVEIKPGLVLAGIEDLTADRRVSRNGDPLSKAIADRPQGATILLSHTPWQYDRAAKNGVGLMLSGHTHGGQIWPFGYLVRLTYPLLEGRYEIAGMTVIVCRGTGTWGPRMRLWHPGEILRVTLHGAKNT